MNDLERLWHDYHRRIWFYLKKHMRTDWLTDEMLAIVYYRAVVATSNGNGARENGGAWLFQIARSVITDHWRHYRNITFVDYDALVDREDEQESLDQRAHVAEVARLVRTAVDQLVESQARYATLRMDGYTNGEIAAMVGSNENAIKQVGTRTLASLRKSLAGVHEGGA